MKILKQQPVAMINVAQNIVGIVYQHLPDKNDTSFTQLCTAISEKSLALAWDNEDDERWDVFLKN